MQIDNERSDTNRRSSPSARFEYLRIKDDRSKERRLSTALSRGLGGLLTGPVVLNKVSRRIWYIPLNGVFRYLFLSAYYDRM